MFFELFCSAPTQAQHKPIAAIKMQPRKHAVYEAVNKPSLAGHLGRDLSLCSGTLNSGPQPQNLNLIQGLK